MKSGSENGEREMSEKVKRKCSEKIERGSSENRMKKWREKVE